MIYIKIQFHYSVPYDELLSISSLGEFSHSQAVVAKHYIESLESFWREESKKIVPSIEKVTGLKFRGNVDCYVVSNMLFEAISHPFTIKMDSDFSKLRGIFVHELLHILFVQNGTKALPVVNQLYGDHNYKVHFPVLLCEKRVLEQVYKSSERQKRVEDLDYVWKDVEKVYPLFRSYKGGVIQFLHKHVIHP